MLPSSPRHRFVLCGILGLVLLFSVVHPVYSQGTLKWSYDTGGAIESSPAVGDDNVLYFGSNDDSVYAVNPDGTLLWSFELGTDVRLPPVIAPDGTIHVGDNSVGKVIALNPDGTEKWTFDPGKGGGVKGEMALAVDGTLYAGFGGGGNDPSVYAINPDGTQFWFHVLDTAAAGVAVGPDGVVCAVDANGRVYLLNSLGILQWDVAISNGGPPIFGEDGTIFISGRKVTALNREDGSVKWDVDFGSSTQPPSIGAGGELYVALSTSATVGGVVAVNPEDGSELWTFTTTTRVQTTPAVGLDGTIYFGADTEEMFAVNPDGTLKWKFETGGDIRSSPTLVENGTLYFGSNDSMFYALNTASPGLAASAWPKEGRDIRNTAQFGSDTARKRLFAPHAYDLTELGLGNTILTMRHTGGIAAAPAGIGTTAEFRVDVRDRDGSLLFSIDESVEPGETKDIVLTQPGAPIYQGSVVVDAPVKSGLVLAPFLTWVLDLGFNAPLQIGAFFSDSTDAAQVHHFPAEASASVGLGIAVQNIGDDEISCTLDFLNADGTAAAQEVIDLEPLGSFVDFFNDSVQDGFKGSATFTCSAPVVTVAVTQDTANGSFPTDRLTWKGLN